ncbi:MAG: hypothetical protein JRI87_00625 [Deltaproteobacteria bacterium]|nr:hypothetical protein [Deltaproteobacteria bacterium]MBW1853543.1 hypothetical protein [Deltaproteobacteria bacterium]
MRKRCFMMVAITLLLLLVPVLAQAHLRIFEGECFRKCGKPSDWDRFSGNYLPPEFLGAEDYSFEYPFIIPSGQWNFGWSTHHYLHRNDIDVIKYELQEGEEFCLFVYTLVPACLKYKNYYPVVGILGPGVPKVDEFPAQFEKPEDCQDCGFMRTHPTIGKRGERFTVCGPPGAFPADTGYWWMLNYETDAIDGLNLQGPGNYYLVTYHPEGKPGDVALLAGTWECEPPEQELIQQWMRYFTDDHKWVHGICEIRGECLPWNEIPEEASLPIPSGCGFVACPYEY